MYSLTHVFWRGAIALGLLLLGGAGAGIAPPRTAPSNPAFEACAAPSALRLDVLAARDAAPWLAATRDVPALTHRRDG